jgi:hypothetical protein
MTFRALFSSDIKSSHFITIESSSTILTLMFVDTLDKRIEGTLRTLEHKRVISLKHSSRWAVVTDGTRISSSVTVRADHTRLATSAVRLLFSLGVLRISFKGTENLVRTSLRAVSFLGTFSTRRVRNIVIRRDCSVTFVTSSASISDQTSSAIVRSSTVHASSLIRVQVFTVRAI